MLHFLMFCDSNYLWGFVVVEDWGGCYRIWVLLNVIGYGILNPKIQSDEQMTLQLVQVFAMLFVITYML